MNAHTTGKGTKRMGVHPSRPRAGRIFKNWSLSHKSWGATMDLAGSGVAAAGQLEEESVR
jgi:hypothetical protein